MSRSRIKEESEYQSQKTSQNGAEDEETLGTKTISSTLLSQLYRDGNFAKLNEIVQEKEKVANRFVTLDTEFFDLNNVKVASLLNDIESQQEYNKFSRQPNMTFDETSHYDELIQ